MHQEYTTWKIGSGAQLSGVARIHGNKNAALPCLAAATLLPLGAQLMLEHVPRIRDGEVMCNILNCLGIDTTWTDTQTLQLTRTSQPDKVTIHPGLTEKIRGSIALLGALAARYPKFTLAKPGGDKIGVRPINAHMTALRDLGVTIDDHQSVVAVQRSGPVRGGTIILTEQSVTATLMLLLYSAGLKPTDHLTIINAASEPHIVTLCNLLTAMGATITGLYSNLLSITWPIGIHAPPRPLRLDDDFMEAATFAVAAAITKSDLAIPFSQAGLYLHTIDRYLGWMGIKTKLEANTWHVLGSQSDRRIHQSLSVIKAEPWPRFPTDVMSMFIVLATQCHGSLKFIEYMYDDRFGFVQGLRDIGAHITQQPPYAITVTGPTPLTGNEAFLRPDIRSGAAMLLAALASEGITILHDRNGIIERGYQELPQTLARLGAPIKQMQPLFG